MLIGEHDVGGGQIALRFPGDNTSDTNFNIPNGWERHWHIDGLATKERSHTPFGDINNFTALVGIVLQDAVEDNMGNLTVYPGSHYELQDYFQREGFHDVLSKGAVGLPRIPFARPATQIHARAGDAIVVNYLVAHNIAPNISPYIRYCVYFRPQHKAFRQKHAQGGQAKHHRPESMLDPWYDWPGLRNALNQKYNGKSDKSDKKDSNSLAKVHHDTKQRDVKSTAVTSVERSFAKEEELLIALSNVHTSSSMTLEDEDMQLAIAIENSKHIK